MTPLTSAIPTVWRTFTRLLRDASFPRDPGVDEPVAVWFGSPDQPNPDEHGNPPMATERVVVVGMVDNPDAEWGPMGQLAREETWRFPIYVSTAIPGRTSEQALARLEELTALVELIVRDINASARTATWPPEFTPYPKAQVAVDRVRPLTPLGSDGYIGVAEIVIGCQFRVGTPPVVPD